MESVCECGLKPLCFIISHELVYYHYTIFRIKINSILRKIINKDQKVTELETSRIKDKVEDMDERIKKVDRMKEKRREKRF